jgi:Fur family ferric uptake transcriptional regulator
MKFTGTQRNTRQREVILEELRKVTSHPTAATLYAIVRQRLPKISLGTVYRNLERLAATGEIQKLDIPGSESRFDGKTDRHSHIRCVHCGRIDDVSAMSFDLSEGVTNDWGGYQVLGHRIEILGLCPECQNQEKTDTRLPG